MARVEKMPISRMRSRRLRRGIAAQALLVALSLPWGSVALLAHRADQGIRQRHAVETIRAGGGGVLYDFQTRGGKVLVSARPPGPAWLRNSLGIDYIAKVDVVMWIAADDRSISVVADLPALRSLQLGGKNLNNDEVLSIVSRLKRLRALWLCGLSINDAGWKPLAKISSLETLDLYGTKLTDAAVSEIKCLPRLKRLVLGPRGVTDARLREIANVKHIQDLSLFDCGEVSDSGLNQLRKLQNLENVTIWGKTKITDQGVDRFQKLAPQVKKLSVDRSVDFSKPAPD